MTGVSEWCRGHSRNMFYDQRTSFQILQTSDGEISCFVQIFLNPFSQTEPSNFFVCVDFVVVVWQSTI